MTDFVAAALVLIVVGLIADRAADDHEHPKVVLVETEWSCRRSHPEIDARPVQHPDGTAGRELSPILVCDAWSRR